MSTEKDQEDIAVVEEKDGSVTVQLPDSIESPDKAEDAGDHHDDGGDEDHPDDTDAIREARRNRRRAKKEYIKRTNEEKDAKLQLLERQNRDLMERLSVVERKTHGADLARFEKAIEDEEYRLQYAQSSSGVAKSVNTNPSLMLSVDQTIIFFGLFSSSENLVVVSCSLHIKYSNK